jgi:Na+-transporting NADH:ubiquinone oxidoreductase subunit C
MQHSSLYTVLFAAALCIVCSVLVSSSAVGLHDRQVRNQLIDQQKKVLAVIGLIDPGDSPPAAEVERLFEENLEARIVSLQTGAYVEGVDAIAFDQRKAAKDPETSRPAPANPARVRRVPDQARIYLYSEGEELQALVLPIEGMGLWSTLYGYVALERDARTIRGLTFYEHGETAGLGGEVDNPRWKALWPGRLAFDEDWQTKIAVIKGAAGPPGDDPYRVDGLSGATLTCNGVTNALRFWLGDAGFGPFLAEYRAGEGGKP